MRLHFTLSSSSVSVSVCKCVNEYIYFHIYAPNVKKAILDITIKTSLTIKCPYVAFSELLRYAILQHYMHASQTVL